MQIVPIADPLRVTWITPCLQIHSLLLAAAPLAGKPRLVGSLAAAGIVLFSGSCYYAALTEDRGNAKLAPFGGFALIGAWLALAL